MNDQDIAAHAWLDVHLQEQLGELNVPDLRHRILASTTARRHIAAQRVEKRSATARWLAAAMLLLGTATVLAVSQLSRRTDTSPKTYGQDPIPQPISQRIPQPEELVVGSLAEFYLHARTATRISVAGDPTSVPITRRGLIAANRTVLSEAKLQAVLAELKGLRALQPAGWIWTNGIRLDLPDGRYMQCALDEHSSGRLGIRGLGDFAISEALHTILQPEIAAVVLKTRLAGGGVMSRQDLLRTGEVSIPLDIDHLDCRGLHDEDLQLLARFGRLTSLDLSGCAKTIEGNGLGYLCQLPMLTKVSLRYSEVEDASLVALLKCDSLRELDVSNHQRLTGECFNLPKLSSQLQTLKIGWGKTLTDMGLAAIAKAGTIRHLDLSGRTMGTLSTSALLRLGDMAGLQSLDLSNLPASMDEVLASLGALPDLRELRLSFTNVSNVGLMAMRSRHAANYDNRALPLRSLELTGCQQLGAGMLKLLSGFLQLEQLKLGRTPLQAIDRSGPTAFDDFADLQRLHMLRVLELDSVRLDADAFRHLARLPSLKHLSMRFTGDGVDDAALQNLREAPQLEQLELSGCDGFGDLGLTALADLQALKLLDLNACDGFTMVGLDAFRKAKPDCVLRLPDGFR